MLSWMLARAACVLPKELPKGYYSYYFGNGSIGTGPFVLKSWDGSTARFVANTNYWLAEGGQRLPRAQSLTLRVITDAKVQLRTFQRGELDLMRLPLALYDSVLDAQGQVRPDWHDYECREIGLNNLKFLDFSAKSAGWVTNAALRRQVDEALDRRAIVQELFKGKARVQRSVVPDGVEGFAPGD